MSYMEMTFAKRSLCAFLLIIPTGLQAQQTNQMAIDFYVGRAVKDAGALGNDVTVDFASRMVVSYFYRVQSNQDGVVSAHDTLDYITSFITYQNFPGPSDYAKYDLNQDSFATQSELEVSLSQKAWVTASTVYAESKSPQAVEERYRELLEKRTMALRDRVGAAPEVDIEAPGDRFELIEDLQKTLDSTRSWGPAFFLEFDANSDLQVDFEEFTAPVFAGLLAADTDGDGVFSEGEQAAIKAVHDAAEATLDYGNGWFSFPDPR